MDKKVLQSSVYLYSLLIRLYPKSYRSRFEEEMKYVFSEALKDTYIKNGETGIVGFWAKAIVDAAKSLFAQHLENIKGGVSMTEKKNGIIKQNKVFAYLALATAVILSIPYMAMRFNWVKPDPGNPADMGVNWSVGDFLVMGTLLFGTGSLFVLVARITPQKYRILLGVAFLVAVLLIWAHLAVGIVDTWSFAGS